jgi:D-alanyl-D-alanine carboxypeptidase (penicillin-binding protein 5/6)
MKQTKITITAMKIRLTSPMASRAGVWLAAPLLLLAIGAAQAKDAARQSATQILAPSYVLMDVDTGRVLEGRAEHTRHFPASTTKTMTALVAIENGELDKVVTIGPNPPKTGEQSANLMQGETFALHDLVKAALIKSANDSCVAIAEGVAGSVPKFVEMMNKRAREVGAKDTHFCNPHGLHNPKHYTTAYDLALIARAAMKHPIFNEIISTKEDSIHGNAKIGPTRLFKNKNKLLFRWNECDGVKTGFTHPAGRCLIASATRVNPATHRPWRLLCVVLQAPDTWTDSRHLLELGFRKFVPVTVAQSGQTMAQLEVKGGSTPVEAIAQREFRIPLRVGEQGALTTRIMSLAPEAPVEKNQPVANLVWDLNGRKIASLPLVAREDVSKSLPAQIAPVAAHVVPSQPYLRWALYLCVLLGLFCIATGWKMRAKERKRQYERTQRSGARRLVG